MNWGYVGAKNLSPVRYGERENFKQVSSLQSWQCVYGLCYDRTRTQRSGTRNCNR